MLATRAPLFCVCDGSRAEAGDSLYFHSCHFVLCSACAWIAKGTFEWDVRIAFALLGLYSFVCVVAFSLMR